MNTNIWNFIIQENYDRNVVNEQDLERLISMWISMAVIQEVDTTSRRRSGSLSTLSTVILI